MNMDERKSIKWIFFFYYAILKNLSAKLKISEQKDLLLNYSNSFITLTTSFATYSASSNDNVLYTGRVISFSY